MVNDSWRMKVMVSSLWFGSVVSAVGGRVLGHDIEHIEDEVVEEPDQVFHLPTLIRGEPTLTDIDGGITDGVSRQECLKGVSLCLHVLNVNGDADDAAFGCGRVNAD